MKSFLSLLLIILFVGNFEQADAQIMYRTRYRRALMVETFASSPIASINVEYLPVRWRMSFLALRGGLGYLPGGISAPNSGGVSFPTTITFNYVLNNIQRGINKRVSLRCKSAPSKIATEAFLESGLGYTLGVYNGSPLKHFGVVVIGTRQQLVIDIPPRPRTIYLRFNVTPTYPFKTIYDFAKGGASAGINF